MATVSLVVTIGATVLQRVRVGRMLQGCEDSGRGQHADANEVTALTCTCAGTGHLRVVRKAPGLFDLFADYGPHGYGAPPPAPTWIAQLSLPEGVPIVHRVVWTR